VSEVAKEPASREKLPPATYTLKVQYIGYATATRESVQVAGGQVATTDVQLGEPKVVAMNEVMVSTERRLIDTKSSTTKQSISAEREIPVDNLSQAIASKAGVVAQGGELHFRGGRSGETQLEINGVPARPMQPPVVPTTGGTKLPNDEAFDSMFFKNYGVNPFIVTDEDALSTFAVDVDAASYTVTRRYLELGQLPPADAVRVEEFINFFAQGYPKFQADDFRILVDGAPSPHERLVGTEARAVLMKALDGLDLDRRAVFVMHELDEIPVPEVASTLGIPLNTAYSRLRLARVDVAAAIQRFRAKERSCDV